VFIYVERVFGGVNTAISDPYSTFLINRGAFHTCEVYISCN
jgi:hypothetical protein